MATPHIQVILAADRVPENLQIALRHVDATASFWPLAEALRAHPASRADANVLVIPDDAHALDGPLRLLFDRLAEHPRGTLVVSASGQRLNPLEHPASLPVTFDPGLDARDLTLRLAMMLELRESLDSLHRGIIDRRRNAESVARQYARQLRLASQLQREFLPENLPRIGPALFDVVFSPVDYVSGDIYDVHRLDEDHVGIALADATGHGIPAALLTVYIKRALRGKEVEGGRYRILPPAEVLARLNDDISDAGLSECPFVAALYGVLNIRTCTLELARGGAPYPLVRRANGRIEVVVSRGGVVGVLPDAQYETATVQLAPGDSIIFYSDGLERVAAPQLALREAPAGLVAAATEAVSACDDSGWSAAVALGPEADLATALAEPAAPATGPNGDGCDGTKCPARVRAAGLASCFAKHEPTPLPDLNDDPAAAATHDLVTSSNWCATLRTAGTAIAFEQARCRQRTLRRMGYPLDDLTLLSVQIAES